MDNEFAKKSRYGEVIGHGMWLSAIISGAIYKTIPGPGSILRSHSLTLLLPTKINDELEVILKVINKLNLLKLIELSSKIINHKNQIIAKGNVKVLASDSDWFNKYNYNNVVKGNEYW